MDESQIPQEKFKPSYRDEYTDVLAAYQGLEAYLLGNPGSSKSHGIMREELNDLGVIYRRINDRYLIRVLYPVILSHELGIKTVENEMGSFGMALQGAVHLSEITLKIRDKRQLRKLMKEAPSERQRLYFRFERLEDAVTTYTDLTAGKLKKFGRIYKRNGKPNNLTMEFITAARVKLERTRRIVRPILRELKTSIEDINYG